MSQNPNYVQVPLAHIEVGMFMVDIDIPWIDSPFIKHQRLIKSDSDIKKLEKAKVKRVTIDVTKGKAPSNAAQPPQTPAKEQPVLQRENQPEKKSEETPAEPESKKASQIRSAGTSRPQSSTNNRACKTAFKEEMKAAIKISENIRGAMSGIVQGIEKDMPIDTQKLTPLLDETLASLERNNQALLNLAHLSRQSQKLVDHSFSVFCLCLNLANESKLSADERHELGLAALLHDTGWVQLPKTLIGKRTPYSQSEQTLIHTHVDIGLAKLKDSELSENVTRMIAEHHENADGSGYPKKLTLDKLHQHSQFLSVVDRYDELIHQLTDQPGMLPNNAIKCLFKLSKNNILDEKAVGALIASLGIYPVTSAVKLNTGEKGIVSQVNPKKPLKPVVKIFYDKHGFLLREAIEVNLADQSTSKIERIIEATIDPNNSQDDPARKLSLSLDEFIL